MAAVNPLIEAAVLAPVFRDKEGELRIVLIVRSDHGIHGGQLALPGGRPEPGDADLLETALRETEEEVGLSRHHVEVLAELEAIETLATGYRVQPYLGRIPADIRWKLQEREIVGLLTPAVAMLAEPESRRTLPFRPAGSEPMIVEGIPVEGHILWGMTLRIIDSLAPRLIAGTWAI
jgi:8-oxo-dGTP pyrophosphatase MutT (NUDIX family)